MNRRAFLLAPLALPAIAVAAIVAPRPAPKPLTVSLQIDTSQFLNALKAADEQIEARFIESRKFTESEIAKIFHVTPEMLP